MNNTVFSTLEFATAWSRHIGSGLFPFALAVEHNSVERSVYAVATKGRAGLMAIEFGPAGFCGSPGWETPLDDCTVDRTLARLRGIRIRNFVWNVRFDHGVLAEALERRGLVGARVKTQVLTLTANHDETFSNFNDTIRNQIRRAKKSGVVVKVTDESEDMTSYYRIHERLVEAKGGFRFIFPRAFLAELVQTGCMARLFLASINETLVGGGVFLRDGDSVFYLHSAHDRKYSNFFPTCAVLNEAIRWANEIGAKTFSFGGSGGADSLERFKAAWGAEFAETWRFAWENPLWAKLAGAMRRLKKL